MVLGQRALHLGLDARDRSGVWAAVPSVGLRVPEGAGSEAGDRIYIERGSAIAKNEDTGFVSSSISGIAQQREGWEDPGITYTKLAEVTHEASGRYERVGEGKTASYITKVVVKPKLDKYEDR